MTNTGIGLYRRHTRRSASPLVCVTDGSRAAEISEPQYRRAGYRPPFDQLPWFDFPGDPGYFRSPPAIAPSPRQPRMRADLGALAVATLLLIAIVGGLPL